MEFKLRRLSQPCPCGSGSPFEQCHGAPLEELSFIDSGTQTLSAASRYPSAPKSEIILLDGLKADLSARAEEDVRSSSFLSNIVQTNNTDSLETHWNSTATPQLPRFFWLILVAPMGVDYGPRNHSDGISGHVLFQPGLYHCQIRSWDDAGLVLRIDVRKGHDTSADIIGLWNQSIVMERLRSGFGFVDRVDFGKVARLPYYTSQWLAT